MGRCNWLTAIILTVAATVARPAVGQSVEPTERQCPLESAQPDHAAGVAACTAFINSRPRDTGAMVRALANRADHYGSLGQPQGSIADLTELLRLDPDHRLARVGLARSYARLNDNARALTHYSDFIQRQSGPYAAPVAWQVVALIERGNIFHELHDLSSAVADYSEALRLAPGNPDAHRMRGWIHLRRAEFDSAVADLRAAVRTSPSSYDWAVLCRALVATGDLTGARAACVTATQAATDQTDTWARGSQAMISLIDGRYQEAWDAFNTIAAEDAEASFSVHGRGVAALALGRSAEGEADIARAASIRPEWAAFNATMNVLAASARSAGRPATGQVVAGSRPAPGAPAAARPDGPRVALVIGIGAYGTLGNLPNPANDARSLADRLRRVGFDVDLVIDPDQRAMRQAISRLGARMSQAGSGATGLFYFAGHGIQSRGINFLIPAGAQIAREADLAIEAVQADAVLLQMQEAGVSTNIMILDACRNMPLTRSFRNAGSGLAQMDAPNGSFIAYSTAPGSVAADGAGANSPFAAALMTELERPGQSIEGVFRNVRRSVLQATGGEQTPWDSSSLVDPFYFVAG